VLHIAGLHPVYRIDVGAFRLQGATVPAHLAYLAIVALMASILGLERDRRYTWLALANFAIITWTGTRLTILEGLAFMAARFLPEVYGHLRAKRSIWTREVTLLLIAVPLIFASYLPFLAMRTTALNPYNPDGVTISLPAERAAAGQDRSNAAQPEEPDQPDAGGDRREVALNTSGRLAAWRFFWGVAQENIWFGRGLGTGTIANQGEVNRAFRVPHNEYLRILVDGGVIGLAVVLAGYVLMARQMLRACPPEHRSLLVAGLAVLAIDAVLNNPLTTQQFSIPFWLYLSLLVYPGADRTIGGADGDNQLEGGTAGH
jgi:hypothetical protein